MNAVQWVSYISLEALILEKANVTLYQHGSTSEEKTAQGRQTTKGKIQNEEKDKGSG